MVPYGPLTVVAGCVTTMRNCFSGEVHIRLQHSVSEALVIMMCIRLTKCKSHFRANMDKMCDRGPEPAHRTTPCGP